MRTTTALVAIALFGCIASAQGRGQREGNAEPQAGSPGNFNIRVPAASLNLPAGDAKRGETYYAKYGCWECHGYTGQTGNGARLATTILNPTGFVNYIRSPRTNQ